MLQDEVCSQCGRSLPSDAPRGLCPACLLLTVLRDRGDPVDSAPGSMSPATVPAAGPGAEAILPAARPASEARPPDPGDDFEPILPPRHLDRRGLRER